MVWLEKSLDEAEKEIQEAKCYLVDEIETMLLRK